MQRKPAHGATDTAPWNCDVRTGKQGDRLCQNAGGPPEAKPRPAGARRKYNPPHQAESELVISECLNQGAQTPAPHDGLILQMIEDRLVNSGPMCMPLTTLSGGAVKRDGPQAHTLADHGAADYTMSMDGTVYSFVGQHLPPGSTVAQVFRVLESATLFLHDGMAAEMRKAAAHSWHVDCTGTVTYTLDGTGTVTTNDLRSRS